MKPAVTFRRGNENDTGELLVMMSRLCQMYGSVFNEQLSKTNLHKIINDESLGRVWVIFCDGVTAGYAVIAFGFSFEYGGRDAFIDELYLKGEFRGKGIGKEVMKFLESEAVKLGVNTLHLEVDIDNDAGEALYLKSGFSSKGRKLLSKKIIK